MTILVVVVSGPKKDRYNDRDDDDQGVHVESMNAGAPEGPVLRLYSRQKRSGEPSGRCCVLTVEYDHNHSLGSIRWA